MPAVKLLRTRAYHSVETSPTKLTTYRKEWMSDNNEASVSCFPASPLNLRTFIRSSFFLLKKKASFRFISVKWTDAYLEDVRNFVTKCREVLLYIEIKITARKLNICTPSWKRKASTLRCTNDVHDKLQFLIRLCY